MTSLDTRLRALTLWQPIASLVAVGAITVETRTWATDPGPIAIHAAKSKQGMEWCDLPLYREAMARHGLTKHTLPFGAVVAVADIVEVVSTDEWTPDPASVEYRMGDYDPGRWCFKLDSIEQLHEPVPAVGRQQVWKTTDEVTDAVWAALVPPEPAVEYPDHPEQGPGHYELRYAVTTPSASLIPGGETPLTRVIRTHFASTHAAVRDGLDRVCEEFHLRPGDGYISLQALTKLT